MAAASPKTSSAKTATSPQIARTRREHGEKGFMASAKLRDALQEVLTDLIELASQGKQAHWNVVGPNFRDLHLQLDELVDAAREFSDAVAERMRALHATADGRSGVISGTSTLEQFPAGERRTTEVVDLITDRIDSTVGTLRRVHDDVDEEDPTSADLLHAVIDRLEQLSWMIAAEHREPRQG